MKPYRPSIRRLQLEFAQGLARKRMLAKHREKNPNLVKTITDNSEPWLANPDAIGDFLDQVRNALTPFPALHKAALPIEFLMSH